MHSKVVLLCFAVFLLAIVTVNSESAFYIPRAFYTIDEDGQQSPLSVIGARHQRAILHRLKRSAANVPYSPRGGRSFIVDRMLAAASPRA